MSRQLSDPSGADPLRAAHAGLGSAPPPALLPHPGSVSPRACPPFSCAAPRPFAPAPPSRSADRRPQTRPRPPLKRPRTHTVRPLSPPRFSCTILTAVHTPGAPWQPRASPAPNPSPIASALATQPRPALQPPAHAHPSPSAATSMIGAPPPMFFASDQPSTVQEQQLYQQWVDSFSHPSQPNPFAYCADPAAAMHMPQHELAVLTAHQQAAALAAQHAQPPPLPHSQNHIRAQPQTHPPPHQAQNQYKFVETPAFSASGTAPHELDAMQHLQYHQQQLSRSRPQHVLPQNALPRISRSGVPRFNPPVVQTNVGQAPQEPVFQMDGQLPQQAAHQQQYPSPLPTPNSATNANFAPPNTPAAGAPYGAQQQAWGFAPQAFAQEGLFSAYDVSAQPAQDWARTPGSDAPTLPSTATTSPGATEWITEDGQGLHVQTQHTSQQKMHRVSPPAAQARSAPRARGRGGRGGADRKRPRVEAGESDTASDDEGGYAGNAGGFELNVTVHDPSGRHQLPSRL
ncbi:hypothetical protein OBBRIDRAFT_833492 [Obba rivulosa]|uniref:Uncharacterized protein n=1 Tax=Obba rivulosa TaxID=1052685 RepID=A0A8E2B2C5_9APHY|nr:hypothetical protein OBBRIDRAFT_833492 [Obba rivulosa]